MLYFIFLYLGRPLNKNDIGGPKMRRRKVIRFRVKSIKWTLLGSAIMNLRLLSKTWFGFNRVIKKMIILRRQCQTPWLFENKIRLIKEFSPSTFSREGEIFMASQGVHFVVGSLGERNNWIFKGLDRESFDVWSLLRFHVSFWASVTNIVYNYSQSLLLLDWSVFLYWWSLLCMRVCFFMSLYFYILSQWKLVFT